MSRATLALLQLCDSLFPLGAFAHSDGLEAAAAGGRVRTVADVADWLRAVSAAVADTDAPAVRDAHRASRQADMDALVHLDDELHALRPSASGREASRAMGTRLLHTWQRTQPSAAVSEVLALERRVTLPVAFGVVSAAAGAGSLDTLEAYMYTRLAATVSAAMRLVALGQHDAHALLAAVLDDVPAQAARVAAATDPPRSFAPRLDIAAMSHQYVHSRLFRS